MTPRMTPPTDEQIERALRLALHLRSCGNISAAKLKLADLRRRLHGERRQALDKQLKKARFLKEVIEAGDHPNSRASFAPMPGLRQA